MTRKKKNAAYIANDAVRRATFRRRSSNLIKKVEQLSTLCDIKACAVIYAQNEDRPVVWPNNLEAQEMLEEFRALPPSEFEDSKRIMTPQKFLQQRATKIADELNQVQLDIHKTEMSVMMYEGMLGNELHHLGLEETIALMNNTELRLKKVREKIEAARKAEEQAMTERATLDQNMIDELSNQNWFAEMEPISNFNEQFGGLGSTENINNNNNIVAGGVDEDLGNNGYGSQWLMPDSPFPNPDIE